MTEYMEMPYVSYRCSSPFSLYSCYGRREKYQGGIVIYHAHTSTGFPICLHSGENSKIPKSWLSHQIEYVIFMNVDDAVGFGAKVINNIVYLLGKQWFQCLESKEKAESPCSGPLGASQIRESPHMRLCLFAPLVRKWAGKILCIPFSLHDDGKFRAYR